MKKTTMSYRFGGAGQFWLAARTVGAVAMCKVYHVLTYSLVLTQ